jgi:predicted phage terminase large subunit-like protein
VVQELRAQRTAGEIRPDRATLGHRQQGEPAQRFQHLHHPGIEGKDLYLLHVLRKRLEYPEPKRAARDQCRAFEANVVLIEDKASGTQLIQELIRSGLHAVSATSRSRQDHAQAGQTAMIENGFVHLPKRGAWLAEYLHELTARHL